MYHDMYNVLVLYTIHKKKYCTAPKKTTQQKTLQSLNRDFMRAFLKLWMIVTIKFAIHTLSPNWTLDLTWLLEKKARSKKKVKDIYERKKTLKELFEWLQMNYYVERKKIVLSSLYSLLLHTTTTKLLRLKMKKKEQEFYECWLIVQWTLILLRANMMM